MENNANIKRHFVFPLFFLLASGTTVVIEFGRKYGKIAYGFVPPLLVIYILYLLGAFIAIDSLRGKINRSHFSFVGYVFIFYLIGAVGTWALSYNLIFALSLLVIGTGSALGFTVRYFHVVYPFIVLIDVITLLNNHRLLLALGLSSLMIYTSFLLKFNREQHQRESKPTVRG